MDNDDVNLVFMSLLTLKCIQVISGWRKDDNERVCAMKCSKVMS